MATVTIEQKVQDLLTQGKPCTEEEIRTILRQDEEASILLVLQLLKRIEELESRTAELSASPSTPSGMIPPYAKPSTNNGKMASTPSHLVDLV